MKPKETSPKTFSFFSRQKASSTVSNQADRCTTPDCSVITPEIPTPDIFHDETGYTFSAVTLGSNPLYNWSIGSSTATAKSSATTKDKAILPSEDEQEAEEDEGESVLDFRITSIDGGGGGKTRPGYLWLPSLRGKPEQSLPKISQRVEQGEEDISPPSSGCEGNCKRQHVHTSTGTGE